MKTTLIVLAVGGIGLVAFLLFFKSKVNTGGVTLNVNQREGDTLGGIFTGAGKAFSGISQLVSSFGGLGAPPPENKDMVAGGFMK